MTALIWIGVYLVGYVAAFLFLIYHVRKDQNSIDKWDWLAISLLSVFSIVGFVIFLALSLIPDRKKTS